MKRSGSSSEKRITDSNETPTDYNVLSKSANPKVSGKIFGFKRKDTPSTLHIIAKTVKKKNRRILDFREAIEAIAIKWIKREPDKYPAKLPPEFLNNQSNYPTNRTAELMKLNNWGERIESRSKRRRFLPDRIGKTVKNISIQALDLRETIKGVIRKPENYPAKLPPEFLNSERNIRLKGLDESSSPNTPEKIVKPENQQVNPVPDKIGQILVKKGIINELNLREAIKRQREEPDKYLGQILSEMGFPQSRIMKGIYYGNKRKKLGDILVEQSMITDDQLNNHLLRQMHLKNRGEHAYLGDLLIESRTINEDNYMKALSAHFSMPIVSLKNYRVFPALQKVIGEQYAATNRFVVLSNSQSKVVVATAKPHLSVLDYLEKAMPKDKQVMFCLARNSEVENCLDRIYNPNIIRIEGQRPINFAYSPK